MRFHQSWEHRLDIERTLKRVDTKNPKNITAVGVFEFVKSVLVLTFAFQKLKDK